MSTPITFGLWQSIVPDKMVDSWVEKKYIPNKDVLDFSKLLSDDPANHTLWGVLYRYSLRNADDFVQSVKWVPDTEIPKLESLGYEDDEISVILLDPKSYEEMREEVGKWYDEIFDYVEQWLFENNLLHISKGSLQTGFCVETDPKHDVVTGWGAPLAKENNKVIQMKEKFGRITVYFGGLTDSERKLVRQFSEDLEAKFDCETRFS